MPPPADDVTRLGGLPPDAQDVTRLGAASADPDVTQMPSARPTDADATYAGTGAPLRPLAQRVANRNATRNASRNAIGNAARNARWPDGGGFVEVATDLVGQDLGERYHIIKLLGAGGMGAVYQAWDAELGVAVALKTVRPEVAADPLTARMLEQRFKQELLLARKVTHKNIVRVHDIGEVDGLKYITMPFLDGEDLSTILKREGKLAVPRVMVIARSVASGLGAAHLAGVVHRDLKPANIMVDADGEGLVMDFGIARSTSGPPAGGAAGTFPAGAVRAAARGADDGRLGGRHRRVHGPGAGAGRGGQSAGRHLRFRPDSLRPAARAGSRGEDRQRHRRAAEADAGVAAGAPHHRSDDSRRARPS